MRRTLAAGAAVAAALALLSGPATGAEQPRVVLSAGPLVEVGITPTLGCSFEAAGDGVPAVYPGGCATFVAYGGSLGGPADELPKWDPYREAFAPVSQSAVLGDGTAGDPYRIVTVVSLFGQIHVTETDSYVVGDDFYRTRIEVTDAATGAPADGVTVYHVVDCFLGGNDVGYGVRDEETHVAGCREIVDPTTLGPRLLSLEPVTEAVTAEGTPDGFLSLIGNLAHIGTLPCSACGELVDNAVAIEAARPTLEFLTRIGPAEAPEPEPAHVSVEDASAGEGDEGTAALTFTVARSGGQAALSIPYTVVGGTATAGTDFAAGNGTVELAEGQASAAVTVQVLGDTEDEPDETLELRLDAPAGAVADRSTATGTILDDDEPPATVPKADLELALAGPETVEHGGTATYVATVANGGPDAATAVTVSFTVTGTFSISPGPGCTALAAVVTCGIGTVPAGSSASAQVTVGVGSAPVVVTATATAAEEDPVPADATAEVSVTPIPGADLAIALEPGWPAHVAPGATAEYVFDVWNDGPDAVPATVVEVRTSGAVPSPETIVEGGIWTCTLATGGLAVFHRCTAGVTPPGLHRTLTVRVPAGSSGAMAVSASIVADGVSQPSTANDVAQAATTIGWLADLGVALSAPKTAVIGMAGVGGVVATATVANGGPDPLPAAVATLQASASGGTAVCAPGGCGDAGPLAPGQSKQLQIPVIATKPALATLSVAAAPGSGFVDPSPGDNAAAASILFVRIAGDDVTATEGDAATTVSFPLELELPSGTAALPAGESFSFDVATEPLTADAGADFVPLASQVTFAGAQTTATVVVTVAGDTGCEPDESFRLRVELPGTGVPVLIATATIEDDDGDCSSGTVGPGGSVSTGTVATPDDPVETTVTTPQGGTVAIVETDAVPPPSAFAFLGRTVEISAPQATVAAPLEIAFVLDGSLLPSGKAAGKLTVFRDGVPIPPCDGAAGASATPYPCVASRSVQAGDLRIVVRSSHASVWTFGTPIVDVGRVTGPGFLVVGDGRTVRGVLVSGRFRAFELTALSTDGRSAWFAGRGMDGRSFLAHAVEGGKGSRDVFRLWIDGREVGAGRGHTPVRIDTGRPGRPR